MDATPKLGEGVELGDKNGPIESLISVYYSSHVDQSVISNRFRTTQQRHRQTDVQTDRHTDIFTKALVNLMLRATRWHRSQKPHNCSILILHIKKKLQKVPKRAWRLLVANKVIHPIYQFYHFLPLIGILLFLPLNVATRHGRLDLVMSVVQCNDLLLNVVWHMSALKRQRVHG